MALCDDQFTIFINCTNASQLGSLKNMTKQFQLTLSVRFTAVAKSSLSYPYFFLSWDNGDTEKMSPWDMEPVPDDGRSWKYETFFLIDVTDVILTLLWHSHVP